MKELNMICPYCGCYIEWKGGKIDDTYNKYFCKNCGWWIEIQYDPEGDY